MVTEILGVVKVVPVHNDEPPEAAAYQFSVPALADAPSTTLPVSHLDAGVVEVTLGVVFIVATTAFLAEVQPVFVAST